MNMAAYRGVYLWEVAREGAGMTMKAAGNSLELLQACAEKTGCALEVLSYGGLPVFLGAMDAAVGAVGADLCVGPWTGPVRRRFRADT